MTEYGRLTEEQISLLVPRKTVGQYRRWMKQLKSQRGPVVRKLQSHQWSSEDDKKLLKLVNDETNSWLSTAKEMGMELMMDTCRNRYTRLQRLDPQLKRVSKPSFCRSLAWKKRQFSEEQIKEYRQLLDSQTLIGKPEEHLSVENGRVRAMSHSRETTLEGQWDVLQLIFLAAQDKLESRTTHSPEHLERLYIKIKTWLWLRTRENLTKSPRAPVHTNKVISSLEKIYIISTFQCLLTFTHSLRQLGSLHLIAEANLCMPALPVKYNSVHAGWNKIHMQNIISSR